VKKIRKNKEVNGVDGDFEVREQRGVGEQEKKIANGADELSSEELERMRRRKERIQRMKREKERQLKIQRAMKIGIPVAALLLALGLIAVVCSVMIKRGDSSGDDRAMQNEDLQAAGQSSEQSENPDEDSVSENEVQPVKKTVKQHSAHTTASTEAPPDEVDSTNVVFIDMESGDILAQRDYLTVINPASMTKVLTVLVAADYVTDLDDTFTMTIDITDYSYSNDCSSVGFSVGETVTVRDLLYGTILPSGGDAAVALATYVAGSHESFVELMNQKAADLGLSDTAHFTNCVGLYDAQHHCTVYDMAMIMEAAMDDELCREVLSAHTYTTSATEQHPEGITISNWFLRRIEDKDTGGEVLCAKTGYVAQSGNCAVSYGVDADGREYVCATTGAHSSWRCIYDHVALYKKYMGESAE
jgi:D-alanyl-D-alanine carboxypeptidase (penicillin-binding protein 5/6)